MVSGVAIESGGKAEAVKMWAKSQSVRLVVRSSACPPWSGQGGGVLWEKVWGCAIASYIEKNMSAEGDVKCVGCV
jgi:hypothetical protein